MKDKTYTLRGDNGCYFVSGSGLVGTAANASRLTQAQADCALGLGFTGTLVEVKTASYAVVYIRKGDAVGTVLRKKNPDGNLGQVDPSKRRFATFDEAVQHGSRFNTRRANRGDEPGSAGHMGFYVIETNDAVNAKINWKTGLTNPVE